MSRAVMQQALEALEVLDRVMQRSERTNSAITALRQALLIDVSPAQMAHADAVAEPEQPVAWMESPHGVIRANPLYRIKAPQSVAWSIPLYPHPPTPRKPLTDEQCDSMLLALNEWARSFDHYEYGLPLYSEELREKAREVIRAAHGIGDSNGS